MGKNNRKSSAGLAVVAPAQPEPHQKLMSELEGSMKKEGIMPRGIRKNGANGAAATTKSVYVKFTEPEDIALYERLVEDARRKRYPVDTYITLVLLEVYPAPTQPAEAQV